jgi:hypothetical protein
MRQSADGTPDDPISFDQLPDRRPSALKQTARFSRALPGFAVEQEKVSQAIFVWTGQKEKATRSTHAG